jgi:hypothetical protein
MDKLKVILDKVTHDLNGPLCTIDLSLYNLKKYLPQLIEAYHKAEEMGLVESSLSAQILEILEKSVETANERTAYCCSYISMMSKDVIEKVCEG